MKALADDEVYRVLRDTDVSGVFGVTKPAGEAWPYREDTHGDKVVEEMYKQLEPDPARRLTRESFSARQRVALRGPEALAAVLAFAEGDDDRRLAELTTRCYSPPARPRLRRRARQARTRARSARPPANSCASPDPSP